MTDLRRCARSCGGHISTARLQVSLHPCYDCGLSGLSLLRHNTQSTHGYLCSFQWIFVDPYSHTILNAIGRGFTALVLDTNNGILVDGKAFSLPLALQRKIDSEIIDKLHANSSYNRPFCHLDRCSAAVCDQLWCCREC
jgi:hypothetical protein